MTEVNIRSAHPSDSSDIHSLLMELAVFEKIEHLVESTTDSTHQALFGQRPTAHALVAESGTEIIATAIFFFNYSTFIGRQGLYLEDIYVKPGCRGKGTGKRLLSELARIAVDRNCGRMEWTVLDWNSGAIDFYRKLGAQVLPEWRIVRLPEPGIKQLAGL
jgi:GNAT superfamily N-acetyltransferase